MSSRRRRVKLSNTLLEHAKQAKREQLYLAIQANATVVSLRDLALSNLGFVDMKIRRLLWPKILHLDKFKSPEASDEHGEESQVQLDVDRSMWSFLRDRKHTQERYRNSLSKVINSCLARYKDFHYYQGLNDIASILLLVLGEDDSETALAVLCQEHIKFNLDETIKHSVGLLRLIKILVESHAPILHQHLQNAMIEDYIFALSWTLTWFSHNIEALEDCARVFDVFLTSHPLYVFYFSAALMILNQGSILSKEPEFSLLHQHLTHLPQHINIEECFVLSEQLFERYPPRSLLKKLPEEITKRTKQQKALRYATISMSVATACALYWMQNFLT